MAAEGRRGLGRGLSALLDEQAAEVAVDEAAVAANQAATTTGASNMAPIELLHPNPNQPRKTFGETELEELAQSIRSRGVIQPLLARPAPGRPGE